MDDDGKALRGQTRLDILEKRRENVVAERRCDHGDAPVLFCGRRPQEAAAAAALFDEALLLQHGQRLPERLAADGELRGERLLARQPALTAGVHLRQLLPQRPDKLLIF